MQVGYENIDIFDQYLASSRVFNSATVRCTPDRGKLSTLIVRVCVQHWSDAHLTVLLWSFVAVRCCEIDINNYNVYTNSDLHMPYSRVLF